MTSAYRIDETYDWNYAHPPAPPSDVRVPAAAGAWDFCGVPISSPLGMPAGPLLNSGWILYYAALGFDVLTYKTVRSAARASYGLPNLLPVQSDALAGVDAPVVAEHDARDFDSWAISFGMPSKDPDVWQRDVSAARERLNSGKVLVVSVVASPDADWTIERIASDFAHCARMARDAGADAIEANLSCPNVCTREGSLYQSPSASGVIAAALRDAIGSVPLILKVGLFDDRDQAAAFIGAVRGSADAISSTNTIATRISDAGGAVLFDGQRRGIGGRAIGPRCLEEMTMLARLVAESGAPLRLIGVGGIGSAADVENRLRAGAHHVQIATAAMLNPMIAIQIRELLTAPTHVR